MATATAKKRGRPQREKNGNGAALRRSISYLFNYPRLTALATVSLLLATAAQLAVPNMVQRIVDSALGGTGEVSELQRGLLTAVFFIIILALIRGIFSFAQAFFSQTLSQNIAFDLRNDIFAKIQRLSFSYHDKNRTGKLMIRATDDVERLRVFIGQGLLTTLSALILLVGSLILMFRFSPKLSLIVLPVLPVTMVLFSMFGFVARPKFQRIQERLSTVNTILQENMTGLKVIKAFASEASEQQKFKSGLDALVVEQVGVSRFFAFLFPSIFFIANLGQAAVLYFGGQDILGQNLTVGEWQEFNLYFLLLLIPMGQLGFIVSLLAQASVSAGRIFEILDAENKISDAPNASTLPNDIQGNIAFNDVTFRYFASSDPVLQNISFSAKAGETVALLGTTGSGKTTVINLIPRFYDVSEGSVTIDGHDVKAVTLDSLRSKIGIVLQETTLFSGSIRENIAFGRPDASDEDVMSAAKSAAAHDFIMSFPDGYNTPVGERGSTLSGGQKQRIAIARALLLDPQILILDDSTSSVDYETEFQIQQALDQLMAGRTSVVIAQRISTVLSADKILVLDQGKIVAQGTHDELMEDSPDYAEIYHSQLSE